MNKLLLLLDGVSNTDMAKLTILCGLPLQAWTPRLDAELGQLVKRYVITAAIEIGELPDVGPDPNLN